MSVETIAKILRVSPDALEQLETFFGQKTGQRGTLEKIGEENHLLVNQTLVQSGLSREAYAEDVYDALVERLKNTDQQLFEFLDKPDLLQMSDACGKLCETALKLNNLATGFFIKKEKAIKMLEKFPPQNLLSFFGYSTVVELIGQKGFSSVFSALRFAQDTAWMHRFFEEAYQNLTFDDFEERAVELKVLEPEWLKVAEKFLEKKYHNVSHLKEFGVIFVVPLQIDTPGETLRLFTLVLHYLNEVPFYSKLFRKFANELYFSVKLKSLLRGDVSEAPRPNQNSFRIVQRYLAKDDPDDFRLAEPHVNPEAEHWYKAEGDLGKLASFSDLEGSIFGPSAGGWQGLDFVGDFFKTKDGKEELISFDLIDLAMSLVKKGEVKYLYHQQEALWNKIFIAYLGREKLEELVEENIIEGFIKL